jgi:hypothetical protein
MIHNATEGILNKPTVAESQSNLIQTDNFSVRSVTEFIADKQPALITNNAIIRQSTYVQEGKRHIISPQKTTLSFYAKPHLITRDGKTYKALGGIKTQVYSYQENAADTHKTLEYMSHVHSPVSYPANTFWIG